MQLSEKRRSLLSELLQLNQLQWLTPGFRARQPTDPQMQIGCIEADAQLDMCSNHMLHADVKPRARTDHTQHGVARRSHACANQTPSVLSHDNSTGGQWGLLTSVELPEHAAALPLTESGRVEARCSVLGAPPLSAHLPASDLTSSDADSMATSLGYAVLILRLAADYLALQPLPYHSIFQGSRSSVWHHKRHRALDLHLEKASKAEWREATAMLNANALFLLARFGGSRAKAACAQVLEHIAHLPEVPCLTWELNCSEEQPWRCALDVELLEREGDEWDVVETPTVPTPEQLDDISHWEAAQWRGRL
uniref:Uncharacterized protein n=1 Tax=Calcidiscus leptoporus TaxID=127549 RepID=A0A7S0IMW8_9EUKA|mmetsp:Transcript_13588/g.31220  ORF Transcript_13588/g.31220 Transcript_13588/m.31220 type:complete len:308 (+) Transcript_13588:3-926(+)